MRAHHALAMAFGAALISTAASASWADESAGTYANPPAVLDEQTAEANIPALQQPLLTRPDPAINATPWSMLRDGAGETINPQTGTPLPWTVQPD